MPFKYQRRWHEADCRQLWPNVTQDGSFISDIPDQFPAVQAKDSGTCLHNIQRTAREVLVSMRSFIVSTRASTLYAQHVGNRSTAGPTYGHILLLHNLNELARTVPAVADSSEPTIAYVSPLNGSEADCMLFLTGISRLDLCNAV